MDDDSSRPAVSLLASSSRVRRHQAKSALMSLQERAASLLFLRHHSGLEGASDSEASRRSRDILAKPLLTQSMSSFAGDQMGPSS